MMKLIRRLAFLLLIVVLVLVAVGLFVRSRIHARPSWYRQLQLDDHTQHLAAGSMNDKLLRSYSAAQDAQAATARAAHADTAAVSTAVVDTEPFTIELSEAEINAFFADWDKTEHWRQHFSKYFQDPVVILENHELILAANLPEWDTVVSLHFFPRLENGKLCAGPVRSMAGTLPLPKSYVDGYVAKLDASIAKKMPEHRQDAEIGPRGWANDAAGEATMGDLILNILHDRPAEPVVMLREPGRTGPNARSLPVKITAIDISDKSVRLTFRLMTVDEREALLQQILGTAAQMAAGN